MNTLNKARKEKGKITPRSAQGMLKDLRMKKISRTSRLPNG